MAETLLDMRIKFPNEPARIRSVNKFVGNSESVVLPLLHFVDGKGFTYECNLINNYGSVSTRALNEEYTASNSKSSPQIEKMTIFGGSIKTDYALIDVKGEAARQDEIDKKMVAAGKHFDKQFFKGNPQSNGKDLLGLQYRLAGNQLFWAGTNGGALTTDLLDQALDSVVGSNNQKKLFMSRTMRRKVSALVKNAAGGKGIFDSQKQLTSYDDVEIKLVDEDESYNQILDFNETRGNSSVTTSIYVVRFGGTTDDEFVQGILSSGLMIHRPPSSTGTSVVDVVESLMGFGIFHPRSAARIGGILNQ